MRLQSRLGWYLNVQDVSLSLAGRVNVNDASKGGINVCGNYVTATGGDKMP